jgi:Domain of unknown function (DUF5069)
MSTYPTSPKEMTCGMMYFPRMLDKIRLHARDQLSEDYHANLGGGMDKRCTGFLRIGYPQLRERVLAGGTDEEILGWCFENGRRLNDGDFLIWNHFVLKLGWNDQMTSRLAEMKQKHGIANRSDIETVADLIDLDEGRRS